MVVIDIDKNKITIPDTVRLVDFPIEFVESFKSKISEIDFHIIQTKKLSRYERLVIILNMCLSLNQ